MTRQKRTDRTKSLRIEKGRKRRIKRKENISKQMEDKRVGGSDRSKALQACGMRKDFKVKGRT